MVINIQKLMWKVCCDYKAIIITIHVLEAVHRYYESRRRKKLDSLPSRQATVSRNIKHSKRHQRQKAVRTILEYFYFIWFNVAVQLKGKSCNNWQGKKTLEWHWLYFHDGGKLRRWLFSHSPTALEVTKYGILLTVLCLYSCF